MISDTRIPEPSMTETKTTEPEREREETIDFDGRIGPKMKLAVKLVARHGAYSAKLPLAESVGPHGSRQYGYETVNRCVKRGLFELDPEHPDATPQGSGAVVLTEKGTRFADLLTGGDR